MNEFLTDLTDKHTTHSYIPIYEHLFSKIRETCTGILEIGVQTGGSMKLWNGYFPNAIVYGIDSDIYQNRYREFAPRVRLIQADAYTRECASTFSDESLDVVIDDGPHTLSSMRDVLALYYRTIKPGGYLIIEDVQDINWIHEIKQCADPVAKWTVIDRRSIKGRYDDILITVQKPFSQGS